MDERKKEKEENDQKILDYETLIKSKNQLPEFVDYRRREVFVAFQINFSLNKCFGVKFQQISRTWQMKNLKESLK